jgi:hypothetical protein
MTKANQDTPATVSGLNPVIYRHKVVTNEDYWSDFPTTKYFRFRFAAKLYAWFWTVFCPWGWVVIKERK